MDVSDSPPALPTIPKPRRRRWWRISWRIFLVLIVLIPVYYIEERIRGRRALERTVAAYEADGESLDEDSFLTKAPPVIENFGATPFLFGVMAAGSKSDERLMAARERRTQMMAFQEEFEQARNGSLSFFQPVLKPQGKKRKYAWDLWDRNKWADLPDWETLREGLPRRAAAGIPEEERSDVRAVDFALNELSETFEELAAAAKRRYAVFTPAPGDKAGEERRSEISSYEWPRFVTAVRLRVLTAATLGRHQEAADLTRIFWRLREARIAEGGLKGLSRAIYWGCCWNACVRDIIRSAGVNDETLAQLQSQIAESWSPERELLQAIRADTASRYAFWTKVIDDAESTFTGDLHGAFRERYKWDNTKLALYCPSGWLSHTAAEDLRRYHVYFVQPLSRLDFSILPEAERNLNKDDSGWTVFPDQLRGGGYDILLQVFVSYPVRTRLMLFVLGMERYRLKHGRYPAEPSVLPDFMASLPKDIDNQPFRVTTSPDGLKSVAYSIGWNLVDDWHGILPATIDDYDTKNADWPVSLPFSPLPPP